MSICAGIADGSVVRGNDVVAELKLTPDERWINAHVSVEELPALKRILAGRGSLNFVLDRKGVVVHSRIAAELLDDVLARLPTDRPPGVTPP